MTYELDERHRRWREACDELRAAYDSWTTAEPSKRASAFAAYHATLEREEAAACNYANIVDQVRRRPRDDRPVATTYRGADRWQRYEFRLRGHVGETMLNALPWLEALEAEAQGQDTLVRAEVSARAGLDGVLAGIEMVGLELLAVRRLVS